MRPRTLMSLFDGDMGEMPTPPLDEPALEALMNGRQSTPSAFEWLRPVVEDLEIVASGQAPVLQPALATLLAEGFSIEKGDLLVTAASKVTGPAPQAAGLPKWRKRKLSELFAGLMAKLAGLGLAAKIGLGLGVAAASVSGAGAAGALPDAAQHAVATVVGAATPFTFPDTASDHANMGETVSSDATGASEGTPGVDGQAVSEAAKAKSHGDSRADPTDAGSTGVGANGVGANTGATGLDRANETPAAGHAPTSLPNAVSDDGSGGSGLDTARGTPADDHVPGSVPPAEAGASGHGPADGPGRP
jgi:hypothetical protein